MSVKNITAEERRLIEERTRGQSESPQWKKYRVGMITGSVIHNVHTKMNSLKKGPCDVKKLTTSCVGGKSWQGNASTRYGIANEPRAKKQYQKMARQNHVGPVFAAEVGLLVHGCHRFLGGSLDMMMQCQCHGLRVVEIKCPSRLEHSNDASGFAGLEFITKNVDGTPALKVHHPYQSQVQCYMALTNTTVADLVVWSPGHMEIIPVTFNPERWANILQNVVTFFDRYLALEILQEAEKAINGENSTS